MGKEIFPIGAQLMRTVHRHVHRTGQYAGVATVVIQSIPRLTTIISVQGLVLDAHGESFTQRKLYTLDYLMGDGRWIEIEATSEREIGEIGPFPLMDCGCSHHGFRGSVLLASLRVDV